MDGFLAKYSGIDGRHLWSEPLGTATGEPGFIVMGALTDAGLAIAARPTQVAIFGQGGRCPSRDVPAVASCCSDGATSLATGHVLKQEPQIHDRGIC